MRQKVQNLEVSKYMNLAVVACNKLKPVYTGINKTAGTVLTPCLVQCLPHVLFLVILALGTVLDRCGPPT